MITYFLKSLVLIRYFAILFIYLLSIVFLQAQAPQANELVQIHQATTTDMNNTSNPETGSFIYNTTINKMFFFDGTSWVLMLSAGFTAYPGHLIITGTGSQTISGLPFQPSAIVFSAHANVETITLNSDNGVGNNSNTIENAFGTMNGYARNDNGTINQQVIYVGGSGTSINNISRYSNPSQCIGIRYSNQNGGNLGLTTATLTDFTADGFTINVNSLADNLLVMFTAYP